MFIIDNKTAAQQLVPALSRSLGETGLRGKGTGVENNRSAQTGEI